jgi:hypothetical protein
MITKEAAVFCIFAGFNVVFSRRKSYRSITAVLRTGAALAPKSHFGRLVRVGFITGSL